MSEYAGDVLPTEAWKILKDEPSAALIDVRTEAEWTFVGVPDLSPLGKQVQLQAWQSYPGMARNPAFEAEVGDLGFGRSAPLLFICRSGQRSRAAAMAMTARGYQACYNVAHGFEGDPDESRQRGHVNGWKACRLPWIQQ